MNELTGSGILILLILMCRYKQSLGPSGGHGSCVMCHVSCLLCTLTTHKWKAADCSMTDLFLQQLKEALICFWCLNQPYDWLQADFKIGILIKYSQQIFEFNSKLHIILGWSAEYWPYQLKRLCSFPYFFLSNPIFW